MNQRVLGVGVDRPEIRHLGVIGSVEASQTGNVILRAGERLKGHGGVPQGWTQTLHIVLEPDEARELVARIREQLGD